MNGPLVNCDIFVEIAAKLLHMGYLFVILIRMTTGPQGHEQTRAKEILCDKWHAAFWPPY